MASRSDTERWRLATARVVASANGELARFWVSLDEAAPDRLRDALLDFAPGLVTRAGDLAASVSANWFESLRDSAAARGSFRAVLAAPVAAGTVQAATRYAARHLWADAPGLVLPSLQAAVSRLVARPGQETIKESIRRDPARPKYARVPDGNACAFCQVLASRGPVYAEATAQNDLYHADCGCTPTPVWPGDGLPSGYAPDDLYAKYSAAHEGGAGLRADLARFRQQQGLSR